MEQANTIGGRIKALREEKQLSVFALSYAAEMQTQTLRNWESDYRVPSQPDVLARLAGVLGVSLDYLVTGKNAPEGVSA